MNKLVISQDKKWPNRFLSDAKLEHLRQVAIALESVDHAKTDEPGLQRFQCLQPKWRQSGGVSPQPIKTGETELVNPTPWTSPTSKESRFRCKLNEILSLLSEILI